MRPYRIRRHLSLSRKREKKKKRIEVTHIYLKNGKRKKGEGGRLFGGKILKLSDWLDWRLYSAGGKKEREGKKKKSRRLHHERGEGKGSAYLDKSFSSTDVAAQGEGKERFPLGEKKKKGESFAKSFDILARGKGKGGRGYPEKGTAGRSGGGRVAHSPLIRGREGEKRVNSPSSKEKGKKKKGSTSRFRSEQN